MAERADDAVEALVARYVEARDRGEALAPEAFLSAHPEGGEGLRRALDALERTEGLFPPARDGLPVRIGPYRVLGELGRGGMGHVLRVEREDRPGEVFALKRLHVSLPRSVERFRREGEALRRLRHPNVVRVVETGVAGGEPYLVMERVEGESLAARIDRGGAAGERMVPRDAARLGARIARAVHAAHEAGVLHRDLSPRNVLLRPDGEPVVIDFGLGRTGDAPTVTGSGDALGTPRYMAPEQARGERVDRRADVWSLGALLFELLTGTPPRTAGDTLALLREAGARPLPAPRRLDGGVPRPLDRVVRRATAFRPAWRTPDAAAVADDLERFAAGDPVAARGPGLIERAHDAWLRHARPISAAAVLVLVALVLLVARREDVRPQVRELHHRAAVAWLDGDRAGISAAADAIAELEPDDVMLEHLRALAEGRRLSDPEEPAVAALVDGLAARDAGRPSEALAHFEAAASLLPNTPEILAAVGIAAHEAGELEAARATLEFLAAPLAGSRALHRSLAEIYLALELPEDALKAATVARRLAPDDAETAVVLERARLAAE